MPSVLHEGLIEIFRQRPSLAVELLVESLGVAVPGHDHVRVESGDLTALVPTEFRADAVVTLTSASGQGTSDVHEPVLAVIVEVQLRVDLDKRLKWPAYVANLRVRLRCPVVLLVVCADEAIARWCARPIEMGPGSALLPLVLGPERVPVVTDVEQAQSMPELAVLSAMAHGPDPAHRKVLDTVVVAFDSLDNVHPMYPDVVLAVLPEAARCYLEEQMATGTYEIKSDFLRRWRDQGLSEGRSQGLSEGRSEGLAEGLAEGESKAVLAVLAVLDARDVDVPEAVRARVIECTDVNQLEVWIRRAATAISVDDLFT